uniref:Equilibrative nucleoside transporter 1 n=2 Tax=Caenorhabditis tropicalis TaxID=1561998 RepID=A0A1I7UD42_9PELO
MSIKIFVAFTIVSISSMFPNNAFMNAHEYFYYKLRNVTHDEDPVNTTNTWFIKRQISEEAPTELQRNFEAYLTVYGSVACVLGSILNVFATKSLSNSTRMVWGHALVVVVFIPTIALTFLNFDDDQSMFFNVSMGLISIACFGSLGLMAGGVLGLSALFPSKYTQAVMVGQSFAGVLAAVMSILCQAITSDVILNGQMYFGFSLLMCFISLATYYYLTTLTPPVELDDEINGLIENQDENEVSIEAQASHFPPIDTDSVEVITPQVNWTMYTDILKKSSIDLTTISVVLIVTLAAYPGLTSLVHSTSRNHTWNSYFSAVASFLLYNCGDLIGRSSANSLRLPRKYLLTIAFFRFLLIPLIAMCNVAPRGHTHSMIPYDGVFILLVILLSISHGFCITNATIGATESIEKESRELAGSIISLIGVTAAMMGGILGVLIIKLV